jgi:hypothetical protein
MLDFINAPKLTDDGAKAIANFGAAALNTQAAKVVAWTFAFCAFGYVSFKLVRELRGDSVKHDVTHHGSPPPPPPATM